jgi:hypothetical protein
VDPRLESARSTSGVVVFHCSYTMNKYFGEQNSRKVVQSWQFAESFARALFGIYG